MIEMASKANAITDWATTLADRKRLRNSQVLTAELQKQWLNGRPIFFLGNLKDIAINSDGTYQMDVEYNWLGGQPIFAQNDIRMSLRCPELIALPMVLAAKARPSAILHSDTAVVAVIDHIVSTAESDASGEKTTALTGVGKCLAAMSLTERVSWP